MEQKNDTQYINCGPKHLFGCICLRNFLLLSDLAHLWLTPSMFEDMTFFVRAQHTKDSHPAGLSRPSLEIRILALDFFFERQTD